MPRRKPKTIRSVPEPEKRRGPYVSKEERKEELRRKAEAMGKFKGKFALIPVDRCFIDPRFQRDLKPARIRKILQNPRWEAFAACVANLKTEGEKAGWYSLLTGQQRWEAWKELELEFMPAIVWTLDDLEEEALVFLLEAERTTVGPLDRWKALLIAEDPVACSIQRCLDECDYRVGSGKNANYIGFVGTLLIHWNAQPRLSESVLELCAWIANGQYMNGNLFKGLYGLELLMRKYGLTLFKTHYIDGLAKIGQAQLVLAAETSQKGVELGTSARAMYNYAYGMVSLLNRQRSTRRIPLAIFDHLTKQAQNEMESDESLDEWEDPLDNGTEI
jgi:hypothetical protein